MKSRGGLGREVRSPPPSLLLFRAPFYFVPLPTIWTPGTGYALTIQRPFFVAPNALWLIWFSLNEIPSSGCDSSFTLLSIASSPGKVILGTNVQNSSKYTTMMHTQLFQCPFNNSKSISCRWYCQCSLEYFHLYKTHLRLATLWCVGKKCRPY